MLPESETVVDDVSEHRVDGPLRMFGKSPGQHLHSGAILQDLGPIGAL
jgi:hypothetical protein